MPASLAGPKDSVISGGRRRITSTFTDGMELVEEYDVITDDLLLRKSRTKATLGGHTEWTVEIGAEVGAHNHSRELLVECNGSPEVVRQDTKEHHVIRIRNLPYPKDVYLLSIDRTTSPIGEIVVRTTNKKYFKRFTMPDMVRSEIPLDDSHVSYDVANNTLVIRYKKHLAILAAEEMSRKDRHAQPSRRVDDKSGECNTQ